MGMDKVILLSALLALMFSCHKKTDDDYVVYKIKEGHHRSGSSGSFFRRNALSFSARFNESAKYTSIAPRNQMDVNKLYGFSECSSYHHGNSARFGWRWLDDRLEILAYTYVHGERIFEYITSVELDKYYDYQILVEESEFIFTCDNHSTKMARGCDGNGGVKYRLYPYFGGDEKAPHNITILLKEY